MQDLNINQRDLKYDFSDTAWHQELQELAKMADDSQPRFVAKDEFFGKIEFAAAVEFVSEVLSRRDVIMHFIYVDSWCRDYLKRPESEHYLPAEADDFPRQSLKVKSDFCSWFKLKYQDRFPRHSNYFNLGGAIESLHEKFGTQATREQISEYVVELDCVE